MLLLFQATQAADSVQVAADELMKEAIANAEGLDKLSYEILTCDWSSDVCSSDLGVSLFRCSKIL